MRDHPIHVTGGCLCGAVRYEARALLKSAYICHCHICRKSTGQPAEIGVPIQAGTLRFTTGTPAFYASSPHGRRAFCAICGSRLGWKALEPENDWLSSVNVGSLDDPADVQLECHIFTDTQLPWFRLDDALPRYKEADVERVLERWREQRLGAAVS